MELNWGDAVTAFWGLETYTVADFQKSELVLPKKDKML